MRKLILVVTALGTSLLAFVLPAAAHASVTAARPTASFSFKHNRISAGVKPVINYKTTNLPKGSSIYLQRQYGTARVWKNVKQLAARSGTASAPAVQMGKYLYRIRVRKSGRTVVTSATRTLYSYGKVKLSNLCVPGGWGTCDAQTVQIGSTIFTYVIGAGDGYPYYVSLLQFKSTSCRSMSLQFGTDDTASGAEAYIEVIQSRSDPQYGSVAIDSIGNFSPKLDGGPFYLEVSETNGNETYVNGHASCYTSSGKS